MSKASKFYGYKTKRAAERDDLTMRRLPPPNFDDQQRMKRDILFMLEAGRIHSAPLFLLKELKAVLEKFNATTMVWEK